MADESLRIDTDDKEKVLPKAERVVDITPIISLAAELAGSIGNNGPVAHETNLKRHDLLNMLAGVGILKEDFQKWPIFYDKLFNPATKEEVSETDINVAMLVYLRDVLKARGIKTMYKKEGQEKKPQEKVED